MPVTRSMNAAVMAQADTTGEMPLIDRYDWMRYGLNRVPEGCRKYYRCKYSGCRVKKVESRDQFDSVMKVVYKGEHGHDPPKGVEVMSSAKSVMPGLKEHSIEVVQIVHSEIKQRLRRKSSESSAQHPEKPDQNDGTGSKSQSASNPVKIPTDSYSWRKYGQKQVKTPEGSRSYYNCSYGVCHAKKMESRDQFNSIIKVVYKGEHKHDPPKNVILKECKVISTAKSLKRKSMSTPELKEHPIDVAHIDDSEIKQRSKRNNSESSVLKYQEKLDQKDTTGSESLSASETDKILIDGYGWIKYGQKQVKSPEGSRSYYKCNYSACRAKKVVLCDQFNSIINVVYKGEHKHDPLKKVILKECKVVSTAKSLKRKSTLTPELKGHSVEDAHIDDSEIKQRSKRNNSESSVLKHQEKLDQKDTTGSESLSASETDKILIDGYGWIKYGQKQVKSPEGSRSYYKCNYSACRAKKVLLCDQFNSIINVVYKGEHKHDPPKKVILKECKVVSTAKSLKRNSTLTPELNEHSVEDARIDDSEINRRSKRNNLESSVLKHQEKPDQKDTTGESLSASEPDKIPIDEYGWIKYSQNKMKSPEGSRSYYRCKYSTCRATKVELCDQLNSTINVVYKGEHKHDPLKRVIVKGDEVISTNESLKRMSTSASGLTEHPIEFAHIDDSEIKQRLKGNSSESFVLKHPNTPDQKDSADSKCLSASEPVKIPTDSYAWIRYGQNKVKSPEGSRTYYKCKYSTCRAKKVELCDQFDSLINVVYKNEHRHDPILDEDNGILTAKSLKRKSISTPESKEYFIEVVQVDDSELKQRFKRNGSESYVFKHPKKPKFIVHAAADVKISADGYKWRKYGQKMVKGAPHPRNCFKCTYAGCTVKKHIQKVVDGSSQVIITYKGLHNHDIPAPKKDGPT